MVYDVWSPALADAGLPSIAITAIGELFARAHEIIDNARHWAHEKYSRDNQLPEVKRLTPEALAVRQAE